MCLLHPLAEPRSRAAVVKMLLLRFMLLILRLCPLSRLQDSHAGFAWSPPHQRVAETEGVALNQFIDVAVAEKLSALRTEDYFRERAERGDPSKAKRILQRAGKKNPPVSGDELD